MPFLAYWESGLLNSGFPKQFRTIIRSLMVSTIAWFDFSCSHSWLIFRLTKGLLLPRGQIASSFFGGWCSLPGIFVSLTLYQRSRQNVILISTRCSPLIYIYVDVMIRLHSPIPNEISRCNIQIFKYQTVALNILITLLISIRPVRAQKRLLNELPSSSEENVSLRVVAILVGPAAPIAIFGIATAATAPLQDIRETAWRAGTILDILYSLFMVSFRRFTHGLFVISDRYT